MGIPVRYNWYDLLPVNSILLASDAMPPFRPAEHAERSLIQAILNGEFPINSNLPAERELSARLGITRPTLREALQRLSRDGWVEIRHGKPTRVRDFWQEGRLGVLSALAEQPEHLPPDFIAHLLTVRLLLAPAYASLGVARRPAEIAALLAQGADLPDQAADFTRFDWQVHCQLTIASGNPVFTLILNNFELLYCTAGERYFSVPEHRQHSRRFYHDLRLAAEAHNPVAAEAITRQVMQESLQFWQASQT